MTHPSGVHFGFGTPFATAEEAIAAAAGGAPPAPAPPAPAPPPPPPPPSAPSLTLVPGAEFEASQRELDRALDKYIAELNANAQKSIAGSNARIASATAARQSADAAASRAMQERMAALDRSLQLQLQENQISQNEYLQSRELGQREAEFSRDLAFRENQFSWQQEMDTITVELEQARLELQFLGEARQERLLMAQLQANPSDTVLYEFYKRGLTGPEALAFDTTTGGVGGDGDGAPLVESQDSLFGDYPEPPPAYSDETLQQLLGSIVGDTSGALYNPNLGGVGAFGALIPSPNQFSRQQFGQLDPTDLGVLESFLKAGVEVEPGGQRVAINPADYFQQVQQSFVPTIAEAGSIGLTSYS